LSAHPEDLDREQEILMLISDILIDAYALESVSLRVEKGRGSPLTEAVLGAFEQEAMERIELAARRLIAACVPASMRESRLESLGKLAATPPRDSIPMRRQIARDLIENAGYCF
jgi:hypothetical protein